MSALDLSRYQLEAPEVLWLLLLLPLLVLLRERSPAGLGPWRSFGALVLRCLALGALLLGLARPVEEAPRPDRSVVFAVDGSASLDPARRDDAARWLREAWAERGEAAGRIVVAAAGLHVTEDLDEALELLDSIPSPAAGTDLRSALELALASLPPARHREVVLLSDGSPTRGDLDPALRVASARDVPVHAVALGPAALQAAVIQASPQQDPVAGREASVSVTLHASAAVAGTLRLEGGPEPVLQPVSFGPGRLEVELRWVPATPGLHDLRAVLDVAGDPGEQDNTLPLRVRVQPRPSALVVGPAEAAKALRAAVSAHEPKLGVTTISQLPPPPYGSWSLLVLLDPDLEELPADRSEALRSWVRGGGRLLVTGGAHGLVTDEAEALADVLPVTFPKTKKQERAPLSVVYCIDRSDSMAGSAKFELAAAGLAQSLHLLPDEARIGVVGFSDFPEWVVPLAPFAGTDAVLDALQRVRVRGGTSIFHALRLAYDALKVDDALVKHVVLLSDGQSTTTFARHGDILTALLRRGVTVTTIAVSKDSDRAEMQRIAEAGGGRDHYAERFADLPRLFLDEMMMVTRTNKVEEEFPVVGVRGSRFLSDLSEGAVIPPLAGYVRGQQRPGSELVLAAADGHPVLAAGRHGRGHVAVLTTDVGGAWSARWRDWGEHAALWTGVIGALLQPEPPERLRLESRVEGARATLVFDAVDPLRNPRGDLVVDAIVEGPGGQSTVPLLPVGPGRYGARIKLEPGGATLVRVAATGTTTDGGPPAPGGELLASLHPAPPAELRAGTFNPGLMASIAERTGGLVNPTPEAVFAQSVPERLERTPRHAPLLWAAFGLLLLDLGWRRLRLPFRGPR